MTDRDTDIPAPVPPILAVDGEPPDDDAYAYEFKWDGYRACLSVGASGAARLTSRNGNDFTGVYPEVAAAPGEVLDGREAVLDGEIVALDAAGRPDFSLLQLRHQRRPSPRLLAERPVMFFAFDVLLLGGASLLREPYRRRRELLEGLGLDAADHLAVPPAYPRADISPAELAEVARGNGLEGIVGKHLDSPYLPGRRSGRWVKKALFAAQEAVVGGWQPGEGHRAATVGSLLLGAYDAAGRLRYIGHVGTGFSEAALAALLERLGPLARADSPFGEPVPRDRARRARWVEPRLVGEVAYRTWTRDGRLRHPVWRGLRPDRSPAEAALPAGWAPAG